jgi:hypothetical protein
MAAVLTPRPMALVLLLIGDIRRRSAEHSAAIRQRYSASIGHGAGSVLGKKTFHGDMIADLKRILPPALLEQNRNRAQLTVPVRHFPAALIFDIDVKVRVRIHPFHFRDGARQLDGLVEIVLRLERVVRQKRNGQKNAPR